MAYTLLACAVLLLAAVPVGTAAFVLGFIYGDSPCVLCWEQRTGMMAIALIGLFVLRYGARPKYVGLAVIVGAWGIYAGLRQTALHAARDIGQGFSAEILGAHTYTWSMFIFWVCVIALGVLLMVLDAERRAEMPDLKVGPAAGTLRHLSPLERLAFIVFLIVVAANVVQAFTSTGPPPYLGQSDPVRFSFNPRHWVWSTEEWRAPTMAWRGRWAAAKPDPSGLPTDPSHGPLSNLATLTVARRIPVGLPISGTLAGLAYDPAGDRFVLTTDRGICIVNGTFDRVLRYTVVDRLYSVDLGRLVGTAFLDRNTVIAVGDNKSYVVLRENDRADPAANFRFFVESADKFDEVTRSRFATVRARLMYISSLAFDSAASSLFTISVPNAQTHRLVVSRFDRNDLTLSEEFVPALSAGSGLTLADSKRSLDEYFVTGATVANSRLLALSAAYSTLLVIDPTAHAVTAAYAIPGLTRPAGVAMRGGDLYVLQGGGEVAVINAEAVAR